MSELMNIAQALTQDLKEHNAEMMLVPEFELRELNKMRVVIVPIGTKYRILSRSSHEELPQIQIGILKRCDEKQLPDMLRLVEETGLGFLGRKIAGATCVSVGYNPVYSPEHLRERGQFTSVIELTFKVIQQKNQR